MDSKRITLDVDAGSIRRLRGIVADDRLNNGSYGRLRHLVGLILDCLDNDEPGLSIRRSSDGNLKVEPVEVQSSEALKPLDWFDQIPDLAIEDAENFSPWEVECKDGCGLAIVRPKLVFMLQKGRTISGVPYSMTSWNRCDTHNLLVGGVAASSHPYGWAVDILMVSDPTVNYRILRGLVEAEFPIIKIRPDHFHVDLNPAKAWWVLIR